MSYRQERWFALLEDAVEKSSKTEVARKLGLNNHSTISLVMSGKYPAKTDRIAARVIAALDCWPCPYLGTEITLEDCLTVHTGATPSHDPARLAHRRMCRECQHNAVRKEKP